MPQLNRGYFNGNLHVYCTLHLKVPFGGRWLSSALLIEVMISRRWSLVQLTQKWCFCLLEKLSGPWVLAFWSLLTKVFLITYLPRERRGKAPVFLASSVVLTYSPKTGYFGSFFACIYFACICGSLPSAGHPLSDSNSKASASENVGFGLCFSYLWNRHKIIMNLPLQGSSEA